MKDLTVLFEQISRIATNAGEMLLDVRKKRNITVRDWREFVTSADVEADELISRRLRELYPNVPILSEESGGERCAEGPLFIVDPIDGTNNYAQEYGPWGVSIAYICDGATHLGVIRTPELKQTYYAHHTLKGAWCNRDGVVSPIRAMPRKANLRESHVWTDWVKGDNSQTLKILDQLKAATTYPRIAMCATQTLMLVASGRLDGYVHPRPQPEDIAAAAYIVEKAGGRVTTLTGAPWSPFSESIIATGGGDFHEALLAIVK